MSEVETLKNKIKKLETELEMKQREESHNLDKIEQLEDTIIRLEKLVSDEETKDSKSLILLDSKDRELRELKDKMGYLRKENITLQQEIAKTQKVESSSVIRLEQKKPPIEGLVNELQRKINQQKTLIAKLKEENGLVNQLKENIKMKEETLRKLTEKLNRFESNKIEPLENSSTTENADDINLTRDLQDKLNKARTQIEILKNELDHGENPQELQNNADSASKLLELRTRNEALNSTISEQNQRIQQLKEEVSTLKEIKVEDNANKGSPPLNPVPNLTEELQNKLNKARTKIGILEQALKEEQSKAENSQYEGKSGVGKELTLKNEQINTLQDKIMNLETNLKFKEEELASLKSKLKIILNGKSAD